MLRNSLCSLSANLCRSGSLLDHNIGCTTASSCLLRQFSSRSSCLLLQSVKPSTGGVKHKPKQPASATGQSPDQILDRYPAIQHLKKFNFRDGKEPYKIYVGNLSGQFRTLKFFSISTTAIGLVAQPLIFQSLSDSGTSAAKAILAISPIFLFTYITPIFIHLLSKRYVTEMSYDPVTDTYTGVHSNFFLQRKQFKFQLSDVIVPEVPGMLTTFLIKSAKPAGKPRPIFVMDTCFTHLEHYGRMMKFDQPIDLRLEEPSTSNNNAQPR